VILKEPNYKIPDFDFNSESKQTGPITRAMKKLLDHKNAPQLALSKEHCAMCQWEQEFSDNPLLFDPIYARQYIKECHLWFVNKQSMCAKCKLKLGEHLIAHQNTQPTSNSIQISQTSTSELQQIKNSQSSNFNASANLIKDANYSDFITRENLINNGLIDTQCETDANTVLIKSETVDNDFFN
jgi:hypothetical protein